MSSMRLDLSTRCCCGFRLCCCRSRRWCLAGTEDGSKSPQSSRPPYDATARKHGNEFSGAVRLEAERDLGPAHHRAAVEKLDHAGLDSCRLVVTEYSSRCDHVAAVPKNDRYRRLAKRIASVERIRTAATFHPGNSDW